MIAEQLTLTGLPTVVQSRPKTDLIDVPFEWMSVDYVMSLESMDTYGGLRADAEVAKYKRADTGYETLKADIRKRGFIDPVGIENNPYEGGDYLTNGHHRVLICVDLGYTHIPITRDSTVAWRDSGGVHS